MPEWNNKTYVKFNKDRTQPAVDLANRLTGKSVHRVVDLGCKTGNSSFILKQCFPKAEIVGIDSSPVMIQKASEKYSDIYFMLGDVRNLTGTYDIIFANASLQQIPHHETLIPMLFSRLNRGGELAVQLPNNIESPLYRELDALIKESGWNPGQTEQEEPRTLSADRYFDILSGLTSQISIWETVYYHRMPDHRSMIDWIRGTKLKPYLAGMSMEQQEILMNKIADRVLALYPRRANGEILYAFKRLFFIAEKE